MLHRIMSYELSMSEWILWTIVSLLAILTIVNFRNLYVLRRNRLSRRRNDARRGGDPPFATRARQAIHLLLRQGYPWFRRPYGQHSRANMSDPRFPEQTQADRDAARSPQDLDRDDSGHDPAHNRKPEHKDPSRQ